MPNINFYISLQKVGNSVAELHHNDHISMSWVYSLDADVDSLLIRLIYEIRYDSVQALDVGTFISKSSGGSV
jgi:hypothetical protein